jgi:hypothetical protein
MRGGQNPFLDILKIARFSFSHGELRHLIFYAALIGSAGIIAVSASFLYYESLGISVGFFGLIFAAFQLSSAFGSSRAHAIEKAIGMRKALTLPLFIGAIFVLAGFVRSPRNKRFLVGRLINSLKKSISAEDAPPRGRLTPRWECPV